MKKVEFSNAHRQKHFDFFNGMNHPHFNITANVNVTPLLNKVDSESLPLNFTIVHALALTANNIKEFRWRIHENEVFEYDTIHPSFTVPTKETDVFSFCTVDFSKELKTFIEDATNVREKMKTNPSIEDEEYRADYLFMSAIPWISFTSIQHAMSYHPHDSVPRISWGKIFESNGQKLMPLAVQAHHALVDGNHMGKFFTDFEEYINSF